MLAPSKRNGGRNNRGRSTVPHREGGHKRRVRILDFKRNKYDIPAIVKSIEYDPMRTAYTALVYYVGEKSYILAPEGLQAGDKVVAGGDSPIEIGNALPLKDIPL